MPSILIVEDDLEIAEAMADVLASVGHRIRIARNGIDGLEKVVQEAPDVILLDVEMPFLDGPGMVRELARRSIVPSAIPIILVSGSADLTAIAARANISHVLPKPFAADALFSLLAHVLATRQGTLS